MATLGEMQDRIADDVARTDLSTQIRTAINRAIVFYQKEPVWFAEGQGSLVATPSQQAYGTADGLPSDIQRIQHIHWNSGSYTYPLIPRTIQYILDRDTTTTYTGDPDDYAWWQQKLYLWPIPDATKTATISYIKNYTTLTSTASTNDWLSFAEDLIEARATWWVRSRLLGDAEGAQLAKAEEIESLRALRVRHHGHVATGRIRKTTF